jgi:hypothetical protein
MRSLAALALAAVAGGAAAANVKADVLDVRTGGAAEGFQFTVTVSSPDTGCGQYADWWEVVGEDGALLYRRILLHSHAGEQPFARAGGPVPVGPDTVVWVRAHMHPGGYGGKVMRGSVNGGFRHHSPSPGFGAGLEQLAPQPEGCAF